VRGAVASCSRGAAAQTIMSSRILGITRLAGRAFANGSGVWLDGPWDNPWRRIRASLPRPDRIVSSFTARRTPRSDKRARPV